MRHFDDDKFEKFSKTVNHELRTPLVAIESGINAVKHYLPKLIESYNFARSKQIDVPSIQPKHIEILSRTLENVEREARFAATYLNMITVNMRGLSIDAINYTTCSIKQCLKSAITNFPARTNQQITILEAIAFPKNDFKFMGDEALMTQVLLNLLLGTTTHANCKIEINISECNSDKILCLVFSGKHQFQEIDSTMSQDSCPTHHLNLSMGLEFNRKYLNQIGVRLVFKSNNEQSQVELIFPNI